MNRVSQENSLDIDLVRAAIGADYEILEELGRGGMAVVYRAKERALDRQVAIKVLPSFMAMDTAFVERFQHEARTAGQLEHPGIVPIYRVGSQGRVIYFVMKLLRGQSLATVLRERTKLGVPELRRVLIETTSALGYAARRGVVHRDIKPDNILLDDEGRCVLTDFGIAKSSSGPLTAAGTSMGTPRYMSPEHARGIPLDGRSDMYSLGVVAYQCLTGNTPFDADDPFAVLYKHINDPIPVPPLETDDEKALFAVIQRMLEKQPEDRFQSAEELIAALGGTTASSAPTLVSASLLPNPTLSKPALRPSGLSATEIIETPTLKTRVRQLANDRRSWVAAAAVAGLAILAVATRSDTTDSSGQLPAPMAAGATTRAMGATTSVAAGTTTGARPDTGATLAAKPAAPPATKGAPQTARTDTRTDSGRPSVSGLTRVSTPAASARAAVRDASRCPRMPPAGSFSLLVDSVADQQPSAKLTVAYDVCGLAQNSPFTTTVKFRKLNQRFRRQPDRTLTFPNVASGPRSRSRHVVDLAGLSSGTYAMDVLVANARGTDLGKTWQFRILER